MNETCDRLAAEEWVALRIQAYVHRLINIKINEVDALAFFAEHLAEDFGQAWEAGWRPDFCTAAPERLGQSYVGGDCLQHDLDYMRGELSRREADKLLKNAIFKRLRADGAGKIKAWFLARVYFVGCRAIGIFSYDPIGAK